MKKKLLIYAHYYHPDVASTGQILKELSEGLLNQFKITVFCVVPSYDGMVAEKYKTQNFYFEELNGVEIVRIRVPEFSKSKKVSRIWNTLAYFVGAMIATFKVGKQDYVLGVSQPPILGGLLGVWGKWMKRAKYIYQIQDFNPEQIIAVDYFTNKPLLWLLEKLDKFSCKQADLVITVGRDLVETLKKRFIKCQNRIPNIALINNWIDEQKIYPLPEGHARVIAFRKQYGLDGKFNITYSGNLGHYYDLLKLLKVIEKFKPGTTTADGREVVFSFIGAGSLLNMMREYSSSHHMDNVVFIPYQQKEDLIYSLNAGDVHWCVNAKKIKGVSCPSKYYGIAAAGKPIIGVLERGTEIRSIIEECGSGFCCNPGDYESVERNIQWFIDNCDGKQMKLMGQKGREYLENNLTKDASVRKYANEILKL